MLPHPKDSSRERKREREKEKMIIGEEDEEGENLEIRARSYQLEALEMARKRNTIVYLETGSGKTLIAVMLLRSYAHLLRKPSPFIAVFLVPTVVLVTQQADVIEMHTDLKVARFWGEMGVDSWDAATWTRKVRESEVFVMTPQILLDCLSKTFIKLDQIKLLIFDECHNARGRSPYSSIMTHFYHRQLKLKSCIELPRIFGMTASPIISKESDYSKQITELETLMNSKVFTVSSESVIAQYVPFSTPRIKFYEDSFIQSDLYNILANNLAKLKLEHLLKLDEQDSYSMLESAKAKLKRHHDTLLFCLDELGPWLATKAAEILSKNEKYLFFWGEIKDKFGEKAVREFCQAVYEDFSNYVSKDICINIKTGLLTPKVLCLIKCLTEYREVKDLRCIVFVDRIITAMVLKSLLSNINEISCWGVQYMAGNNSNKLETQSKNEQNKIVDSFRKGQVNIIVATKILEEGLDVPSCNLVIRFDPSSTVSSFIQSKGRARMVNSDYLILLNRRDERMQRKVCKFLKSGEEMRVESIKLANIPCKNLETEISKEEFYVVEKTGAIVTLSSSISLIYSYCNKLPSDRYFKSSPRFVIDEETGMGTLYLPKSSPVQVVQKTGAKGKDMLKRIVCLEACKILHENGALNDYLLPIDDTSVDDDDDDDDVDMTGMEEYNEEQPDYFPGVLLNTWSDFIILGIYHCYKISFNQQNLGKNGNLEDIILVLSSNLGPDFESLSFNLETDMGILSINFEYIGKNHFSRTEVKMARRFQVSIFSILIDRDVNILREKMQSLFMHENDKNSSNLNKQVVYLLLPCKEGKVDWSTINQNLSSREERVQTNNGPFSIKLLQNSVVYTPHSDDFYCVNGILKNLNLNSNFELRTGEFVSYKKYYKSRHGIDLTCENAPLLSAKHITKVQNFFTKHVFKKDKGNDKRGQVELPPELCKVMMCPISVNILNSFIYIPTIMHRIECIILASVLKIQLGHCLQDIDIPTIKILEAITAKKCHEEYSLESLETLGDSFLKYAASKHLFMKYKHHHEGILSPKKERLVSNSSLCRLGCLQNLPGYIRTEEFNPKSWSIPCLNDSKNTFTNTSIKEACIKQKRFIKTKIIADVMEALIGACLSTAGEAATFLFLEKLGIGVRVGEMGIERPVLENPGMFVNVGELERLLRHEFGDQSLLVEALTHGSYQTPDIPRSYQVLGDVIESLAGAIYIDSNGDKDVVWRSIKPLLEPIVTPETMEYHPVRELEELCSKNCYNKSYELTNLDGQSCMRVQVEADGVVYSETKTGPNKKTAQKMAAKAVLLRLKG